jgi:hypothetical protein
MSAALCLEVRAPPERRQVAERVVANEHDVTTAAAVAAVGTPLRHVCLATEAQASVASAAGLNVDASSILHSCGAAAVDVDEILVRPTAQAG